MENEFIPYKQALALKELGFNENCIAVYQKNKKLSFSHIGLKGRDYFKNDTCWNFSAPLYQQAFKWFREKYKLDVMFCRDSINSPEKQLREYKIISTDKSIVLEKYVDQKYWIRKGCFKSYEEAELECLIKLIEICQKKQ